MPDIAGDVRFEQAWGGFHFGALLHEEPVSYNGLNNPTSFATSMRVEIRGTGRLAPRQKMASR